MEADRDLVGRGRELRAVSRLEEAGARLLTIVGPAGVGKSRLAAALVERRPGGGHSLWCDLAGARSLPDVCCALASALGVRLSSPGSPADALGHRLAELGERVVVLDNLEECSGETAAFVAELVAHAREVRLIVTTTARLGVPAEACVPLGPLAVPHPGETDPASILATPAVRLFLRRARAVDPDYRIEPADAPLVARLVRELDGLPLALELCAGRASVLSLAEVIELLPRRLELLVGGHPGRHGTLRCALDGAWSSLEPALQHALATCSVFEGGWDLAAALAVLGGGDPLALARRLQELHDRSWIRVDRPDGARLSPRYRLLESVRAYAAEQLAEADRREAVLRHARHYAAWGAHEALRIEDAGGVARFRHLLRESRNLDAAFYGAMEDPPDLGLAALACLALEPVHRRRGSPRRLAEWIAAVMEGGALPVDTEARLLLARARLAACEGDVASCLSFAERARLSARRSPDRALAATVLIETARFHPEFVSPDPAPTMLEEARAKLAGLGEGGLEMSLERTAGVAALQAGFVEEAVSKLASVARESREHGADREQAMSSFYLGNAVFMRGELDEAALHWTEAARLFEELADERNLWIVRANIGLVSQERGDADEARACFIAALARLHVIGDLATEALVYGMVGDLEAGLGDLPAAAAAYELSIATLGPIDNPHARSLCLARLGAIHARMGRTATAEALLHEAARLASTIPGTFTEEAARLHLGHLEVARAGRATREQRIDEAVRALEQAETRLAESADRSANSDIVFARRSLEQAIRTAREALGPLPCLRLGPDASWMEVSGRPAVSLAQRPTMRRVVAALVAQRGRAPGQALRIDALFEAGWPDERAKWGSTVSRVHVMVMRLRRLGLDALLEHHDGGYRLAPQLRVEVATAPPSARARERATAAEP